MNALVSGQLHRLIMDITRASKVESKKTLGAVLLVSRDIITFGERRLTTGSIYTDKLFTDQREMVGCAKNILQRFYSPATLT